jgi:Flp pilus assembly protein TadG
MKHKTFTERGQALILITLAAIGLFGIVGLAIDGSAKFSDQRHAQNAADTAAVAAALAKANGLTAANLLEDTSPCPPASGTPNTICTALLNAGFQRATSNGYSSNLTSNTVEVYSPPVSGYYAGNNQYVQVIITSFVDTYFARVIGINRTRNVVQAVALARPSYNLANGAMFISYDPHPGCSSGGGSGGGSVDISGSGTVNLYGGGIFLNSQETCGYLAPNCPTLNITGGAGISSAATVDNIDQKCYAASESLGQTPVGIPDDISWPPVPPECGINPPPTPTKLGEVMAGSPLKLTGEWLIYPGFYETFPPSNLVGNKQLIYMKSGVYCIDPPMNQDLSWSPVDFVSLNGSTNPSKNKYHTYNPDGVTLYIKAGGGFTINSNNPTLLDATTKVSSDYKGYLIVLEGSQSSHPTCTITGGGNLDINGAIFVPYCNVTVNGGSESTAIINAQLFGWHLTLNGNNIINFNYDPNNQVKIKRRVGLIR